MRTDTRFIATVQNLVSRGPWRQRFMCSCPVILVLW